MPKPPLPSAWIAAARRANAAHPTVLPTCRIDHVTITIHMVDPEVGEKIYPWIYFKNKRWTGRDAAKILHERHMEGLEALTAKEAIGLLAVEASTALLIVVATKGGGRVNEHFGQAKEFQIHEVDARGVRWQGQRRTPNYCEGGWGDEETLDDVIKALDGGRIVLCSKIGHCPQDQLKAAGITATDAYALEWIETAATAAYAAHTGIGAATPAMACA